VVEHACIRRAEADGALPGDRVGEDLLDRVKYCAVRSASLTNLVRSNQVRGLAVADADRTVPSLVSPFVDALRQVDGWPCEHVAVGVTGAVEAVHGDADRVYDWASVSKLASALAVLVAAEEGIVDLDEAAGPPGSTLRHLLAHASGLQFDEGPPIARPGTRRI
jgi:CubicO group peptidase (beta-lactamase class C family)